MSRNNAITIGNETQYKRLLQEYETYFDEETTANLTEEQGSRFVELGYALTQYENRHPQA